MSDSSQRGGLLTGVPPGLHLTKHFIAGSSSRFIAQVSGIRNVQNGTLIEHINVAAEGLGIGLIQREHDLVEGGITFKVILGDE